LTFVGEGDIMIEVLSPKIKEEYYLKMRALKKV